MWNCGCIMLVAIWLWDYFIVMIKELLLWSYELSKQAENSMEENCRI